MALGRPVVVADDCGASEYIRSGVDGFVVQPGNVQQMRSALSELIGDPAGARRIGQNAYATAKRYTPEAFCNAVLDIVTDCAGMGVR